MKNIDNISCAGFKQYNLVTFSWYVTDYCNFKCNYCAEMDRLSQDKEQCDEERRAYKIILSRLSNKLIGDFSVELIGGEPTRSAFLPDILNKLDKIDNCRYYELITNLSRDNKYLDIILTERDNKFYLKPSFHPEYYTKSFCEKILKYKNTCNVRPTVMLHDSEKYFEITERFLDTLIDEGIEFDLQTIYPTRCYEPKYTEKFNNRFAKYFEYYKTTSNNYNIDLHLCGNDDQIPYKTTDGKEYTCNVNDIKLNNMHTFMGFKCTPLYWQIDPNGVIKNSCTYEVLQYDLSNLRRQCICPVKDGCVEKHKLYYHKER